jgi:hypothetical protein
MTPDFAILLTVGIGLIVQSDRVAQFIHRIYGY